MKRLANSRGVVASSTAVQRDYFQSLVEKYGCPLEAMFVIGANDEMTPELRLRAMSEAAQYGMSKLKSVELTGADGGPIELAAKMDLVQSLAEALDTISAAKARSEELLPGKEDWMDT